MADEADQGSERAPWTIKGIAPETRQIAKDAANRAGSSVGEWLATAVRQQADRDRGNTVLPPGKPGQPVGQTERALALVGGEGQPAVALDLTGLADALRAAVETAQAADELPQLRGLSRDVNGLLRDQLRAARRMSPLGRRRQQHEDDGKPG